MGRWRTIRDNYVRSLKKQTKNSRSGSAAKKTKLYVYGEQLSFLGKNRELRNTDSNFEDQPLSEPTSPNINEGELNSSVNIEDGSYHEIAGSSSSSLNEKSTNKRKKPNVEQALVDFMESHNNKFTKNPIEQDEDMAFFYSLLPTVKSLTVDQKFSFRMQTMQLLNNIKNKTHINRSFNSHSNIQSLLNTTPATSFRPLSHTPDRDFVRPPSATSSAASYYSEFSRDEYSNDNFNLQENYNQTNF